MARTPSPPPESAPAAPATSPPPRAGGRADPPRWPAWIAPAGVVFGYFAGALLELVVFAAGGNAANPGPITTIVGSVLFDLGAVAAAVWLVSRLGTTSTADFGYRRVRPATAAGAFAVAVLGYYGATAIYGTIFKLPNEKLPSYLGTAHSTAALTATAVFVCVAAPILEELFFRGFVFGALRNMPARIGRLDAAPWVAAVLTGILFGLAHTGSASPQYLLPLGFLGFVLCLVRWRTRSLYPCMALHSANNALALGVDQSWTAPEVIGLLLVSWLLVAAVTWPLGARHPALA